ncbi:MAG: hypothetical protein AAF211_03000 [Myxococcota bacterium]
MSVLRRMYEGGGARPVSWPKRPSRNTFVEGVVIGIREKQLPDFKTKNPETWKDGSPKMTPIFTLQTHTREDADDDGRRDLYLRSHAYTAVCEALRAAFPGGTLTGDDALKGCTLKLAFYKTEPGSGEDRKLFKARITRPSTTGRMAEQGREEADGNGSRDGYMHSDHGNHDSQEQEWHSSEDVPFD